MSKATELRFKDTIGDGVEVNGGDEAQVIIEKGYRFILSDDGAREVCSDGEVFWINYGEKV